MGREETRRNSLDFKIIKDKDIKVNQQASILVVYHFISKIQTENIFTSNQKLIFPIISTNYFCKNDSQNLRMNILNIFRNHGQNKIIKLKRIQTNMRFWKDKAQVQIQNLPCALIRKFLQILVFNALVIQDRLFYHLDQIFNYILLRYKCTKHTCDNYLIYNMGCFDSRTKTTITTTTAESSLRNYQSFRELERDNPQLGIRRNKLIGQTGTIYFIQSSTHIKQGNHSFIYYGQTIGQPKDIKIVAKAFKPQNRRYYQYERKVWEQLYHQETGSQNTIKIMECLMTNNTLTIIMPFCEKTLYDFIHDRQIKLSESDILSAFTQMVLALNYLHGTCRIVHQDIKPNNVLLKKIKKYEEQECSSQNIDRVELKDFEVKIADFGNSQIVEQITEVSAVSMMGTYPYMAPECFYYILNENKHQIQGKTEEIFKIDTWSLGAVLFQMLTCKMLIRKPENQDYNKQYFMKHYKEYKFILTTLSPKVSSTLFLLRAETWKFLLYVTLAYHPAARINLKELNELLLIIRPLLVQQIQTLHKSLNKLGQMESDFKKLYKMKYKDLIQSNPLTEQFNTKRFNILSKIKKAKISAIFTQKSETESVEQLKHCLTLHDKNLKHLKSIFGDQQHYPHLRGVFQFIQENLENDRMDFNELMRKLSDKDRTDKKAILQWYMIVFEHMGNKYQVQHLINSLKLNTGFLNNEKPDPNISVSALLRQIKLR